MEKLQNLKQEFIGKLNVISFEELVTLLEKTNDSEFRGMILDSMQMNHEEKFIEWIG